MNNLKKNEDRFEKEPAGILRCENWDHVKTELSGWVKTTWNKIQRLKREKS